MSRVVSPMLGLSTLRPFPAQFTLQNLLTVTAPVFELKRNPHQEAAERVAREWFAGFGHFDDNKLASYLEAGRYDLFAALSFPNAEPSRLETCLAFFLWAFSADDLTDEGEFQSKPLDVQATVDKSKAVIQTAQSARPAYPYAAMLYDILGQIRSSASPRVYTRFCAAWDAWSQGQVKQSENRSLNGFPSVEDFIVMRRATIGGGMVEAIIQYSLNIDLPDSVLTHPMVASMSDIAVDLMAWPNDLCSFNKEQADGDFQNLVCVLMAQRQVDLQPAVDMLTTMISEKVEEYAKLKRELPSFGQEIDAQLADYHKNLEHFVQGTVAWYYASPRYFPPSGVTNVDNLVVELTTRVSPTPA